MKFNKNQTQNYDHFLQVQKMQLELVSVAMANDIVTSTTIEFDKGGYPFLKYKVFFTPDTIAFEGDTRLDARPYSHALSAIDGHFVSMLFPPAKKHVELENGVVKISHWRRIVLTEEDVTGKIHEANGYAPIGYGKNRSHASKWVGFDAEDREVCRIADGEVNYGYAAVTSVRYENDFNYGAVVFVDHDTPILTEDVAPTPAGVPNASKERRELFRSGQINPQKQSMEKAITKMLEVAETVPEVLTREQFDAKPEEYRSEYISIFFEIIHVFQQIWEHKLNVTVPERFTEFVKNFLKSNIAEKEWRDLYFSPETADFIPPVPTLLSFTMNKFNINQEVRKELFGDIQTFMTDEEKEIEDSRCDIRSIDPHSNLGKQSLEPDTFTFGTMTGVLPKVMTKEEFANASEEEKAGYFTHVSGVVKLFSAECQNLKKENPDTFEKLNTFLKDVIQSCIFEDRWRETVVSSQDGALVLTCDAFTAKAIGMSEEVYVKTYGARNVYLTQRMAAMIRVQSMVEEVKDSTAKGKDEGNSVMETTSKAEKAKSRPRITRSVKEQLTATGKLPEGKVSKTTTNSKPTAEQMTNIVKSIEPNGNIGSNVGSASPKPRVRTTRPVKKKSAEPKPNAIGEDVTKPKK